MRSKDFTKGTLIQIPSKDGRYVYAQVIAEFNKYAPLLGLLEGVFDHSLTDLEFDNHSWKLKKYAYVNTTSSRAYPSVASWVVYRKGEPLLSGITEPKAVVHGTRTSGWTVVLPDGKCEFVDGQKYYMKDFEDRGYAGKTMWRSTVIEKYMFEDAPMEFPDT